MFNTPVALIAFNRPGFTETVLQAVARVKPTKLFVIADGPRPDRPDDVTNCAATRAVFERIDWNCKVIKNYADINLGCGKRPATGISWVFEQVEEAIILEDDCVPDPSFFRFCEEMLSRYRDDPRVVNISGSTFRRDAIQIPFSYCFSQFPLTWGWATWRRAWKHHDMLVSLWPQLKETSWLTDIVENERAMRYWSDSFDEAHTRKGAVSFWDHQWTFACWVQRGLSILPRDNLVSNIGCGTQATHCFDADDLASNLPAIPMSFPLQHPPTVFPDRPADRTLIHEIVVKRITPKPPPLYYRIRSAASRLSPPFVKRIYRRMRNSA